MIDHMTFRVANMAATRAFYTAALAPLGYVVAYDAEHGGSRILGFGHPDPAQSDQMKIDTWFMDGPSRYGGHPVTTGCHLCWAAPSRAAVDVFYQAALAHGGKDNGAPGVRALYHPDYYGAFVIDPDGNNVEAVCHRPPD